MSTISELVNKLSTIAEIGMSQVVNTEMNWKDPLLSGKVGHDLVDLYVCKNQANLTVLVSKSEFSLKLVSDTVGQMVDANSISLGYPMFYIEEALGLSDIPLNTSYALLYRSASVVLNAERLGFKNAILMLESSDLSTEENNIFTNFASILLTENTKNYFHKCSTKSRVNFYFGLFDSNKNQIK
jgi:hypothetical protein